MFKPAQLGVVYMPSKAPPPMIEDLEAQEDAAFRELWRSASCCYKTGYWSARVVKGLSAALLSMSFALAMMGLCLWAMGRLR